MATGSFAMQTTPRCTCASERAGQRVMASLTEFIEGRLRLKVNEAKSAVARPEGSPLPRLPAAIRSADRDRGGAAVGAHQAQRDGAGPATHAAQLGAAVWMTASPRSTRGCAAGTASSGSPRATEMQMMRKLDAHIRRRLRAIILRHWKRRRTIAKRLIALGVNRTSSVEAGLSGPQVLVGAEPRARGRPGRCATRTSPSAACSSLVDLHHRATSRSPPPTSPQLALWG